MMWLLACSGGGPLGSADLTVDAYLALDHGVWTYRDDHLGLDGEAPPPEDLLHAEHVGDGVIELRRGLSFDEGVEAGHLDWHTATGLALTSWALDDDGGEGDFYMTTSTLEDGALNGSGPFNCTTKLNQTVETWHGTTLAVVFDCFGEGMDGTYAFAYDLGLVQVDSAAFTLDLVGPW